MAITSKLIIDALRGVGRQIKTHSIQVLIVIAITNFNRQGIFA